VVDDLFTQTRRAFLIPDTVLLPLTEAPGETWTQYFQKGVAGLALQEGEKIAVTGPAIAIVSPGGRFAELSAQVKAVIDQINAAIDTANEKKLRTIQVTYNAY